MAGPILTTEALVLAKRPPGDRFQAFTVFSPEHGVLLLQHRITGKAASGQVALDLFDSVALTLEQPSQSTAWFVKEARLLHRHAGIGASYEALTLACAFATLVARNQVEDEARPRIHALLTQAFAAFAAAVRPDVVYVKSLYLFARDEGHPLKQAWFPLLSITDRALTATLLNRPLAEQTAAPGDVADIRRQLENYLREETELLLD